MMYYRGPAPYADERFFGLFAAPLVGGFFGGLIGGGIAGGLVSAFSRPRPIIAYPPIAPYGYGGVPPVPYGYGAYGAPGPYGAPYGY
ncbi:hypothetical protein KHA93_10975 [Bacillus sp. FJAT-49732]|uniref:Uncharacterized protein n=1 Tax=Lederbergia citrisecunda TaxID=2833583 RepID=A0A942TQF0_9BACI|nr:hypothetical protein [Lederbergia citrisecunda]MBS4200152.1 hypothetical protein [Lederbergia citrisecunda]